MAGQADTFMRSLASRSEIETLTQKYCRRKEAAVHRPIIDSLYGLDQLASAWETIETDLGSPTQHYIWTQACAEAFHLARRLHVVAVGPAWQPVAIAPLVRQRGLPRLGLLGMKELHEPMDLLYSDTSSLDRLASALAELPLPIWIERAPGDSPVIAALKRAYRRRGIVRVSAANGYPYIPLDSGWVDPAQKFNAGRRSDFRRAQRNADKMGTVNYEVHSPTPAQCEQLLEEAFRVEAAGWKGAQGSAIIYDQLRAPFYRRYAANACARGLLRLCFLRINGQAAAMQLAVECGGRFWLLKIGHDETFARCSPGMLLMLHTVRYAATRGLLSYEFLGTTEPWTQVWTQAVRPAVSLRAYPIRALAMATLAADAVRFVWVRLRRHLRIER